MQKYKIHFIKEDDEQTKKELGIEDTQSNSSKTFTFAKIYIDAYKLYESTFMKYFGSTSPKTVAKDAKGHVKEPFRVFFSAEIKSYDPSLLDKIGISFIKLGFYLFLSGVEGSAILAKELGELQESIIDVIGHSVFKMHTSFIKFARRFPNLSSFGSLATLGASIAFMDVGFGLLDDSKFQSQIEEYKRFRSKILEFIDNVINRCKNTKLNAVSAFLVSIFKGLRYVFSKVKSIVSTIKNIMSRNQTTSEQAIIQEGLMDTIVGRILKFLLRLTGVSVLIAIAFAFLDDVSGGKLIHQLEKYDGPFKQFFQKLISIYEQVKTKIHTLFRNPQTT